MLSMRRVRAASKPSSPALLPFVQNTLGEGSLPHVVWAKRSVPTFPIKAYTPPPPSNLLLSHHQLITLT